MAFKADASFLQFLTMGASGVRKVMQQLAAAGFMPIELERHCASNKIWSTKVKRLRLPDVLCVRTGLRVEVRAKSDLRIRMSDAPNNLERRWDFGLRGHDVVAFIACSEASGEVRPAEAAVFFTVKSLRQTEGQSKLGPPKSASEGAERDRTWSAIVPSRDGIVLDVTSDKLFVLMHSENQAARKQTYSLKSKTPYVRRRQHFKAHVSIIAGDPKGLANLSHYHRTAYDPLTELHSQNAIDRYAAVKALRFRRDLAAEAKLALENLLDNEIETRVALEAAGSAAVLDSPLGQEKIRHFLWNQDHEDLRMEAVFILTELRNPFAREELNRVATTPESASNELRAAAVWGLGKTGHRAYEDLVQYIAAEDEKLALHAITAFGADTPPAVIRSLAQILQEGPNQRSAAASEALRIVGSKDVLESLVKSLGEQKQTNDWILATLGRLPLELVRSNLRGHPVMSRILPILLTSKGANWLSTDDNTIDIAFLLKQHL